MKLKSLFCCLVPDFQRRRREKAQVKDAWPVNAAAKPSVSLCSSTLATSARAEDKTIEKSAPLTLADLIHSAPPPSSPSPATAMLSPSLSAAQEPGLSTTTSSSLPMLASSLSCTALPPAEGISDCSGTLSTSLAPLLPSLAPSGSTKPTLVLDLDETLIHSSFSTYVPAADFTLALSLGDSVVEAVYVQKRPHVDHFLASLSPYYELVIFTASLASYANLVIDLLDPRREWISHRLYRESCVYYRGSYIKDLSRLGRPLNATVILDNSPMSYAWHPHHAIPIASWYSDPTDVQLLELVPSLIQAAVECNAENALMARFHAVKSARSSARKKKDGFVLASSSSTLATSAARSTPTLSRSHSLESSIDLLEHSQQQQQQQQQLCSSSLVSPLS